MKEVSNSGRGRRISELDALRGIAAIGVMIYHFTTRFGQMYPRTQPLIGEFPWGEHGVALFFMLSGYVIFMTLERTRSVGEFAIGRFSRLFPAFWTCMLLTYVVVRILGLPGQEATLRDLGFNFTMMPKLFRAMPVDGVYWSLEFEWWFYGGMAVLFALGAFRSMSRVLVGWMVLAIISHVVLTYGHEGALYYRLMGKLKVLASLEFLHLFAIGMTFFDVHRSGVWTKGHALVLALCGVMVVWTSSPLAAAIVFALAAILHFGTIGRMPWLNAKPLTWFGLISYPLYLVHQNIGYILLRHFDAKGWDPHLGVALACIGSIGLAALITQCVELPVMHFIREAKIRRMAARPMSVAS